MPDDFANAVAGLPFGDVLAPSVNAADQGFQLATEAAQPSPWEIILILGAVALAAYFLLR